MHRATELRAVLKLMREFGVRRLRDGGLEVDMRESPAPRPKVDTVPSFAGAATASAPMAPAVYKALQEKLGLLDVNNMGADELALFSAGTYTPEKKE